MGNIPHSPQNERRYRYLWRIQGFINDNSRFSLKLKIASYCIDAVELLVSDLVAKDKSKDSRQ